MPQDTAVLKGVVSFLEWVEKNKVKFLSSEEIVYSRKYGYCGSLDFEARVNGKLYLGDFKTGNSLYNEVFMQTAAYAMARIEEGAVKFYDGRYILRIAKETEDEYNERTKNKNKSYLEPYKIFEGISLNEGLEKDFKAFINFQRGFLWNKEAEQRLKKLKNL